MGIETITKQIKAEIEKWHHVLRLLEGRGTKSKAKPGRRKGISAAGRKRIAAAQRARWAKIRAGK